VFRLDKHDDDSNNVIIRQL